MHSRDMIYIGLICLLLATAGFFWWHRASDDENSVAVETTTPAMRTKRPVSAVAAKISEPIQPLPEVLDLNPEKVALGRKLFHDPLLSGDGTVLCASCHDLATGGVDRKVHSTGVNGGRGRINTPTVFNSGFHSKLFWDGRAQTLEAQIDGPLLAENEMASSWQQVIAYLEGSGPYGEAFEALYPERINENTVKNAIATFERSLYTPNARFDRYLRGDEGAITAEEKAGYKLFKTYGCVKCHQGMTVGGNHFDTFGVIGDYFADRGDITKEDFGRFNVTGDELDRFKFKVCSLRNVALTPPYFHDGSAATLEDAVTVMARYQLGRRVSEADVKLIVKFLSTLTGEYNGKRL